MCPKCGAEIAANAGRCPECGTQFNTQSVERTLGLAGQNAQPLAYFLLELRRLVRWVRDKLK